MTPLSARKAEYPPLWAPGLHAESVDGIRARCVDPFSLSRTRQPIMDGLTEVVAQLRSARVQGRLLVDGSFVTQKINPSDVDTVLHCKAAVYNNGDAILRERIDWLNEDLKTSLGCDTYYFFTYPDNHPLRQKGLELRAYWLRWFGFSRDDQPKGIPYVEL